MANSDQKENINTYQPIFWFCIIGIFLCLQFAFSIKVEEPYPCVRLPGFGSIPQKSESIEVTNFSIAVLLPDDQVVEYTCRKNFPTIPQWYVPYFSNSLINRKLSDFNKQDQIDFKNWLKEQVSKQIGRADFLSVEIRKNKQVFNKTNSSIQEEVINSKVYKFEKE